MKRMELFGWGFGGFAALISFTKFLFVSKNEVELVTIFQNRI